jgi:hypothetical protein
MTGACVLGVRRLSLAIPKTDGKRRLCRSQHPTFCIGESPLMTEPRNRPVHGPRCWVFGVPSFRTVRSVLIMLIV